MTATIHSLPVELVTRIFVLGANFDYPYTTSPFLFEPVQNTFYNSPPQDFQITVSQICRSWRTIALRTSCLWSTLHFHEPVHIQRAQHFLSRCSESATFDILISTVSQPDHIPNVTLYNEELCAIFELLVPHVKRWRSFHLKIRNNDCKLVARRYLTSCGPGPNLETLQLYHFEDFGTSADLYIATYRPPVTIFDNDLPKIKNISLIGVNLPWEKSPYLQDLESLELALHLDNVRPSYIHWDKILRGSPALKRFLLHYSGPKVSDGKQENAWPSSAAWSSTLPTSPILLEMLEELSLTDLDSEYLCKVMESLILPSVQKLSIELSDQNYSNFVGMLVGVRTNSSRILSIHKPLPNLHLLSDVTLEALDCSIATFSDLVRSLSGVRRLDVDFSRLCGGEGWKVFASVAEGDGDQASVATDEHDVTEDARSSHRTPTPPHIAEPIALKLEHETGLVWALPQGPVPRPLSSRGHIAITRRDASSPSDLPRRHRLPGILPRLEMFRIRALDGVAVQRIIAARSMAGGHDVRWVLPCTERALRKDVVLASIVETQGCSVHQRDSFVRVVVEWRDEEEDDDEDGDDDAGDDDNLSDSE